VKGQRNGEGLGGWLKTELAAGEWPNATERMRGQQGRTLSPVFLHLDRGPNSPGPSPAPGSATGGSGSGPAQSHLMQALPRRRQTLDSAAPATFTGNRDRLLTRSDDPVRGAADGLARSHATAAGLGVPQLAEADRWIRLLGRPHPVAAMIYRRLPQKCREYSTFLPTRGRVLGRRS
jgi:hypothetical protein